MRAMPNRFGNVLLAHSDGQGMPAVESAIAEAMRAAAVIRARIGPRLKRFAARAPNGRLPPNARFA